MNVPDGWRAARLAEVASWASGGTPSRGEDSFYGGVIPWAVIGDLTDGPVTKTRDTITEAGLASSSAKIAPVDAVLLAMYGSIGKLGLPTMPMATNQAIAFAVPGPYLQRKFLFYYLLSQRHLFERAGKGATQRNISQTLLKSWPIPLPPLPEQRRIVEIVEEQMAHLDAADASLASAERLLPVAARGAFEAFRHGRGEHVDLSRLVTIANGQTPSGLADRLVDRLKDDYVAYYKVGDMNMGDGKFLTASRTAVSRSDAAELRLHVRPAGTLVLPKRGGAIATNKKRLLSSEAAYDLNTMGLIPGPSLNPEYLWHWFQGIDLRAISDGSNVPQINGPAIRSLRIPVPDLMTQGEIVAECNNHREKIERGRTALRTASTRAAALRRAVLTAAFSGHLTSTTDPSDLLQESIA